MGVAVTVSSLEEVAVPVMNVFGEPVRCLNVEVSLRPYCYSAYVNPGVFAGGNNGADVISGLEAMNAFRAPKLTGIRMACAAVVFTGFGHVNERMAHLPYILSVHHV